MTEEEFYETIDEYEARYDKPASCRHIVFSDISHQPYGCRLRPTRGCLLIDGKECSDYEKARI